MALRRILLMGLIKMNKLILVDDICNLKTGTYDLTYQKDTTLNISGNVIISHYDKSNCNLNTYLTPNSTLTFTQLKELNQSSTLNIKITENTKSTYNLVIINTGENKLTININILSNNNQFNINIRTINTTKDSAIDIICNGYITKNTHNNILVEDLKGLITHEDTIKISPNIYVSTEDVEANHFVTIGSFNEEELFYLTSKGLSLALSKQLLLEGFLESKLDQNLQSKLNREVINNE